MWLLPCTSLRDSASVGIQRQTRIQPSGAQVSVLYILSRPFNSDSRAGLAAMT